MIFSRGIMCDVFDDSSLFSFTLPPPKERKKERILFFLFLFHFFVFIDSWVMKFASNREICSEKGGRGRVGKDFEIQIYFSSEEKM